MENQDTKLAFIMNEIRSSGSISNELFNKASREFLEGESDIYIAIDDNANIKEDKDGDSTLNIISVGIHEGQKTLWVFSWSL